MNVSASELEQLETRLAVFEVKYRLASEDFYRDLMEGKLSRYDDLDETRSDFSRWRGIYETWRRRKSKQAG